MQRALDPSLERSQRTETYIQAVSGITGDASRLNRGDGFVYLADVAPTLRHLGLVGDSVAYRRLRRFVQTSMMTRDSAGAQPRRRFRVQAPFEPATPYSVRRLGDALALGWQAFADTGDGPGAPGERQEVSWRRVVGGSQPARPSPFLRGSGRPDPGAAAEVLLALRDVRSAGPH